MNRCVESKVYQIRFTKSQNHPDSHPDLTRQWWRGPILGAVRGILHTTNTDLGSFGDQRHRSNWERRSNICSESSRSSHSLGEVQVATSSSCLGGLARSHSLPGRRTLKTPHKTSRSRISTHKRRQWSSSPEVMENSVSVANSLETHISPCPLSNDPNKLAEDNLSSGSFVNHAAIAWVAERREWIGDQTRKLCRAPREPIISWCTTYDDLLSTNNPFPQPIPLSEMVDFLVDIWHEEGLYD